MPAPTEDDGAATGAGANDELARLTLGRMRRRAASAWAPPPDLTISQWADRYRYLSPETAAEPGKWYTDRAPYLREIMDCIGDRRVAEVAVMTSAQVGKTSFLENCIGYFVDQDPAPMLLVQPTVYLAETFSKDRLAPMLRDTPRLRGKIKDARARDSGNTMLHKQFPGGRITMVGANAPGDLAGRSIRVVLLDEVDRYPPSAGTEGDPISLARKRANTFWNRKIIQVSTPAVADTSRILPAWESSDQRRYHVPCPHCGHLHVLSWKQVVFDADRPRDAVLACPDCGGIITDQHKPTLLRRGVWIATHPGREVVGFHLNELYSPWRRISDVVVEFLASKDYPEKLKTWVNTSLGEAWEERGAERLDTADRLRERASPWDAQTIPDDVRAVTIGVDTQDDRLEATRVAWLPGRRPRVISHHVLPGAPSSPEVWAQLDALLAEPLRTDAGRPMRIAGGCIDAGGHHAGAVLDYCAARRGRRLMATRGQGGARPIWPKRSSKSARHGGQKQWFVGVDTAKDWLRSALAVRDPALPCHVDFSGEPSLGQDYYQQLVNEKRVVRYDRSGTPTRHWVKVRAGARVEALDCLVLNLAALEMLRELWRLRVDERVGGPPADADAAGPVPDAAPPIPSPTPPAPPMVAPQAAPPAAPQPPAAPRRRQAHARGLATSEWASRL